ncbi:hypothetical protein CMO85_05035 [Candidatus Woesearchaeota archaeon]|nr:hypothetical protein [Candidatus Woesearchaeota archaeon]
MRYLVTTLVLGLFLMPILAAGEEAWAIHAEVDMTTLDEGGLSEVYMPLELAQDPSVPDDYIQWSWWSWSADTGSDWPDDDALYRASNRNISLNATASLPFVEHHPLASQETITLEGKVKVVSAEDRVRMVAFDIAITPQVNLSNHTILYVVLTENVAEDQQRRQVDHLVRELRPEVSFSVKANTTTEFVSMLPADHLEAAGVNLASHPTGWSYSVAVFGNEVGGNNTARLLALAHGDLPSPSIHSDLSQAWTPLLLSAITAVIAVSIIVAVRQREQVIPKLQATWESGERTSTSITIRAGLHDFRITNWQGSPPWRFKRRPPKLNLPAGESKTIVVDFREAVSHDCHIEVAIDIETYGAWKQHLWLKAGERSEASHQEEE